MALQRLRSECDIHLKAIAHCWRNRWSAPTLHLLYRCIDMLSWMEAPGLPTRGDSRAFVRWTERYLVPHCRSDVCVIELWNARCRIHGDPGDSCRRSIAVPPLREVVYCTGTGADLNLRTTLDNAEVQGYVPVKVEDLVDALNASVKQYIRELEDDPHRARIAMGRMAEITDDARVWHRAGETPAQATPSGSHWLMLNAN